jgi:putative oxidoreductase
MNNTQQIGTTILRVVLGIIFFVHGLDKFQGGIENTVGWFESISLPGFLAYVVAVVELVGGLALIIGFCTRIVSAILVILLAVATLKVKLGVGFLGNGQMAGYELDLALLVIALYLALSGSYLLSLDSLLRRKDKTN